MSPDAVLPDGKSSFKMNEVCKLANVQPYMLRFWGTEFPQLEAKKSGTGQRLYSRDQVALILEIRRLLFDEGLTIAGVRKRIAPGPGPATDAGEATKVSPRRTAARRPRASSTTAGRMPPQRGAEVDKEGEERVQRLLSTLREVRTEIARIMADLKHAE
ncbi:MAG: MerR family transcriptional regulator [Acidobacteria bacterium]|nr:MerR family transcriptional regulator [Acidobacteriota bacterium]